jgi:hypothetical protein
MVDPVLAMKLRVIFSDGVGNYQSIKSREALWGNAIDQGTMHWLVGSGAGERVLGIAHAHNLVLDYFRGLGVFGAAAIVLLCITVLLRAGGGGVSALVRRAGADEKRTWACYAAAGIYVLCNQLSDCFGPSTIAALWLVYLPAVMTAPPRIRRSPARAWVALPARPTIPARTPQGLNPQI